MQLRPALVGDAPAIADLHLRARRAAMPWLQRPHTDDEVRQWFGGVVCDRPGSWWVAEADGQVVGYMRLEDDHLDHLYVLPAWQGRGVGSRLLNHAKTLSPQRLHLFAFQRNARARVFYEARGFHVTRLNDGSDNEEQEPDVEYVWSA